MNSISIRFKMELNIWLVSLCTIILLTYHYLKKKTSYWADRGVPFVKPELFFGNMRGVTTKVPSSQRWLECYNELRDRKSPIGGLYIFTDPVAMALDLDLLRNIFVKDFQYFKNHGTYLNESAEPLTATLFNLEDDNWKFLRSKMSPTFTSGKMKQMFPTIRDVGDQLKDRLVEVTKTDSVVEFKELLRLFTTDVICSTAFGVESNTLKNENQEFLEIEDLIFGNSKVTAFKFVVLLRFPKILQLLRINFWPKRVEDFIMSMVGGIVKHREESFTDRKDFMNLLLQLKNNGVLDNDNNGNVDAQKISFNQLAAQVFQFFIAGFETSSSTLVFCFYELAMNQDIQQRAREEIQQIKENYNGEATYESVAEMTYLDQVING